MKQKEVAGAPPADPFRRGLCRRAAVSTHSVADVLGSTVGWQPGTLSPRTGGIQRPVDAGPSYADPVQRKSSPAKVRA
jgi:hypothetical protein